MTNHRNDSALIVTRVGNTLPQRSNIKTTTSCGHAHDPSNQPVCAVARPCHHVSCVGEETYHHVSYAEEGIFCAYLSNHQAVLYHIRYPVPGLSWQEGEGSGSSIVPGVPLEVASRVNAHVCAQVGLVGCGHDLHHGGMMSGVVNRGVVEGARQIRAYLHVEEVVASLSQTALGWLAYEEEWMNADVCAAVVSQGLNLSPSLRNPNQSLNQSPSPTKKTLLQASLGAAP